MRVDAWRGTCACRLGAAARYWQLWQNRGCDVQPLPLSHAGDEHWTASPQLWLPVHVTSHAHELLHETPLHDATPMHATSHGPGPHWMF